jgi:hypothetical protein
MLGPDACNYYPGLGEVLPNIGRATIKLANPDGLKAVDNVNNFEEVLLPHGKTY